MKRSPLLSIFLIVLVDVMGLTIIIPLLPFYAQHYGASPVGVGFLFASYALCQLVAGPILGLISDRAGRKPVLLVSQIGTFLGFLLLAYSRHLWLIFLARIIDGLTAGNLTVAQAYIADVTEPQHRAKSFALIGIAFGLGFLLGPAVPAFLSPLGYHYPILFAAFLSLLSILGTIFLLTESKRAIVEHRHHPGSWFPWKSYLETFRNSLVAPLLWQFLMFIFPFAYFISGFGLFAERRFTAHGLPFTAKEVGYLYAYVGFIGIIIQGGLVGRLVKRLGEKRLIQIGFACMVLGSLLLGWVRSIPLLIITLSISFFGSSILRPCLTSLITQRAGSAGSSQNQQGVTLGLTQSLMSLSQIVAPVIGSLLIEHRHLSLWAWAGAAVSAVGLWLCRAD